MEQRDVFVWGWWVEARARLLVPCIAWRAELDGAIELVAGAFSQDPERSRQAGVTYRISPDRAYTNL